jgi:hypothetical protein
VRALRRMQREQEPKAPFVFTSERGPPLRGFLFRTPECGSGSVGGGVMTTTLPLTLPQPCHPTCYRGPMKRRG